MIKSEDFCSVANSVARDTTLSLKAKGLYLLIQSYIWRPIFGFSKQTLKAKCKEGSKAFDSAWKELKSAGYLKQHRIPRGKSGTFCYEYELLDVADRSTPPLVTQGRTE